MKKMTTSEIREIIAHANHNNVNPTCQDIAGIVAQRTGQEVYVSDMQDKLDDMENNGMIVNNAGKYSVNPTSSL